MANLSDYFGPVGSTANQWDIKNGKTAYIASGKVTGSGYFPAAMKFNGSTGYYRNTSNTTGNKLTAVFRLKIAPFAGGGTQAPFFFYGASSSGHRCFAQVYASDAVATHQNKLTLFIEKSAGGTAALIVSKLAVADSITHTCMFSYDGDLGTVQLIIDGVDADDTGHGSRVLTASTIKGGASSPLWIGAYAGPSQYFSGEVGFFGYRDAYLTNWSDFMQADGTPKQLDESTWAEWGSTQPLFWHESAMMTENKGSAGAMTKTGTITLAAASSWS